ncbi:MAG: hypothetical protein ACYDAZ_05650 [Thermoplasmataceae archaeon]
MSKLLLAFMCMVLLVVPALMPASSAMGTDHEITLASSPQVTVNLTKVVNVNVSYAGVIVATPMGLLGVKFDRQNWSVTNISNGYSYSASFELNSFSVPDYSELYGLITNLTDNFSSGFSGMSILNQNIPAQAYINITRYSGNVSTLNIVNDSNSTSMTLTGINTSTLEMSFSMVFNSPHTFNNVPVPFDVVLIQAIRASENTNQFIYNKVKTYDHMRHEGEGLAMAPGTYIKGTKALYWWNNNFTYNGKNGSDNASMLLGEENMFLLFVFKIPSTPGQISITQDPYVSVLGADISSGQITVLGHGVINYVFQHAAFMAGGLMLGSLLLAGTYLSYRKNRIKI